MGGPDLLPRLAPFREAQAAIPSRASRDLCLLSLPQGVFGDREQQRAGAVLDTTEGSAQSSAAGSHPDTGTVTIVCIAHHAAGPKHTTAHCCGTLGKEL